MPLWRSCIPRAATTTTGTQSRRRCRQPRPTDSSIKAAVVERLRKNLFTKDFDLRVDVKRGVVILAGVVDSRLAKRSAGDDCWDTVGVIDVSNQLEVAEGVTDGPEPVRDFMTTGVVALEADAPLQAAGAAIRDSDVGSVVVMRQRRGRRHRDRPRHRGAGRRGGP